MLLHTQPIAEESVHSHFARHVTRPGWSRTFFSFNFFSFSFSRPSSQNQGMPRRGWKKPKCAGSGEPRSRWCASCLRPTRKTPCFGLLALPSVDEKLQIPATRRRTKPMRFSPDFSKRYKRKKLAEKRSSRVIMSSGSRSPIRCVSKKQCDSSYVAEHKSQPYVQFLHTLLFVSERQIRWANPVGC